MVFGSIGRIGRLYLVQARIVDVESGVTIGASTRECRCDLEEAAVRLVDEVSADLAAATRGFSGAPPDSAGVGALREEQKTGAKEGTPWAWIAPAYIIVWAIYLLVWW